eukprot:gene3193-2175_t
MGLCLCDLFGLYLCLLVTINVSVGVNTARGFHYIVFGLYCVVVVCMNLEGYIPISYVFSTYEVCVVMLLLLHSLCDWLLNVVIYFGVADMRCALEWLFRACFMHCKVSLLDEFCIALMGVGYLVGYIVVGLGAC